jgi:type 1 fimbria pilin
MKNKIALTAGLLLVSSLFGGNAFASDTQDVNFTGTVPGNCTLTLVTPGIIVKNPYDANSLYADDYNGVGTSGVVNLRCSAGSATMSVDLPVAVQGVPNPVFSTSHVKGPSNAVVAMITSDGSTPTYQGSVTSNDVDVPLKVGMEVRNNGSIPPGSYSYNVTVTATDN